MTSKQRLLLIVVFVVAVAGGGVLAMALLGGSGPAASPSPIAVASPSSSTAPGSEAPSPSADDASSEPASAEPPSTEPSPTGTASAAPTASPTPKPANPPGAPTTVVVQHLLLDAKDDPNGTTRKLTFQSQGSGKITVAATVTSPQGNVIMCLSADGKKLGCKTTAKGSLVANTTTKKANFLLTLRGEGIETPLVDIKLTFPAATPSLAIANARFDGTGNPDANGLQVLVQPRKDGNLTLSADWGGHPFLYEIDLFGMNGTTGKTLANQGPATRVSETLPVTAADVWRLLLQNIETGFGPTTLDATIAWP